MISRVGIKLRRTDKEGFTRFDHILCGSGQAVIQLCEIFQVGSQFNFGNLVFYDYLCRLEGLCAGVSYLEVDPPARAFDVAYELHVKRWNRGFRQCW